MGRFTRNWRLNQAATTALRGAISLGAAATLLGIGASAASAGLLFDVRLPGFAFGDPGGKQSFYFPGISVTVNIYLRGGDTELLNGLGQFAVGVRSFNETENNPPSGGGAIPWTVGPTPTNTVVNASGGTNATNPAIMDFGFSAGTNTDSAGIGSPDVGPDTDLDRLGLGASQSATGGWDPTYGKVPELLLGTAVFTAPTSWATTHLADYAVDLNAFFSGAGGAGGGAVIKSLTGSDTTTNAISATNLITGSGQIGSPVHVVPMPEPGSLWLLAIPAMRLLRRRRGERCGSTNE